MEKTFHLGYLAPQQKKSEEPKADVRLKRGHLWLSANIAEQAFGSDRQVYAVYYPDKSSLLLAPYSDEHFSKLHKASLVLLKDRSLAGDKSLSLQEIIIDHDLPDHDRDLEYTSTPGLQMLQISLM